MKDQMPNGGIRRPLFRRVTAGGGAQATGSTWTGVAANGLRDDTKVARVALHLVSSALLASPAVGQVIPAVSGSYRSSMEYPRVFTTPAALSDVAVRANVATSYSQTRFGDLTTKIKADLASTIDWDETYSGCRQKSYLFAFSYEPQEAPFLGVLRSDLGTPAGRDPPAGAAPVAARLALYAALIRRGVKAPPDAPSADATAALAKRILLAWADRGFRNAQGGPRSLASFDCDDGGKPYAAPDAQTGLALSLGRGAIYAVEAQDLLTSLGVLDADELRRLGRFQRMLFDLIRLSSNKFDAVPHFACERYANGQANAAAALLAIARLLDERTWFFAALDGESEALHVSVPWKLVFDRALHGAGERASECYPNHGRDSLTSRPSYVTTSIAPGEINDRYRNANPLQGIGYATFTLERMIDAAEVLRSAGFYPYSYKGAHGQSLELSIHYYACFGRTPGFGKVVGPGDAGACENGAQYLGKVVDGVDRLVVFGASQFADDPAIVGVESGAKAEARLGPFASDPILFGKWRD